MEMKPILYLYILSAVTALSDDSLQEQVESLQKQVCKATTT